jgi:glycosyltransferase involved in cell wall biosynthesis
MTWRSVLAENRKLRKRIGMIVHGQYLSDARVRRQAECLADAEFEVHVVCSRSTLPSKIMNEPSYEVVNDVHIHRIPLNKRRGSKPRYLFEFAFMTLFGIWKLAALHWRNKFDVVHIHNMPDILILSGLIPKWTGAVLVLDVHDPMSELFCENYHLDRSSNLIRILELQERFSYALADHLVTVSVPMAENVAKKRGCAKEDISVVHNYTDLNTFPIREDGRQWPFNKDGLVFLYSGTVTEHYRLDIAVKALAIASREIPKIRLQILGEGNRLDHILSLARELGIADKVEFLPIVKLHEVKNIMANADVGISPHQAGVFGDLYFSTKIIEFMTQGLPVVSSRTYTIDKYIPEDAIFYFEPENVEDLARQMIFMYHNPAAVADKIRNSKKLLSKYIWQEEKGKYLSFYRRLTGLSS